MIRKTQSQSPVQTSAALTPKKASRSLSENRVAAATPKQAEDRANLTASSKHTTTVVALNDDDNPAPDLSEVRNGRALIKLGMRGDSVRKVQELLTQKGFGVAQTGEVGPTTEKLIKDFQRSRGLDDDGVVGKGTLGALESQGKDVSGALSDLKGRYVSGNRVKSGNLNALGNGIDKLLTDPAARVALIERYGLNSDTNKKALVAVTAIESGSNGDMGEVMTTVMNRAITENILRDITGLGGNTNISEIVNDGNQFASRAGFNRIMRGGDTSQRHYANFGNQARGVLNKVLEGQHTFKHNASNIFYFDQGGARHQFRIGVHRFREGYSGKAQHYAQDFLHQNRRIRW